MPTCLVSGNLLAPSGSAASSVTVVARVLSPVVNTTQSTVVVPSEVSSAIDASGNFSMTLEQGISVVFSIMYPITGTEPMRSVTYTATVPAQASAQFTNIITQEI